MLSRHEEELLNFSQHRISNACAEGFNSAIQLIKATSLAAIKHSWPAVVQPSGKTDAKPTIEGTFAVQAD